DFTHWQNEAIRSEAMNSQRDYWLNQLGGELPVLELPTDYPRPAEKNFAGEVLHFDLPHTVFNQLQAFNESNKLTLFMGLIGFYHLTLFKYTGQKQIIIGIPISGRYHPDLNDQIGYYLNTLPIKLDVEATDTLESYFKRLKETVKNAFDNQVYPFDELMGELNIENNPGRSGLYDVMFGLQNFDQGQLMFGETTGEVLAVDSPTSKFDLTMVCEEKQGNLSVNLEYATDLFNPQTINQLQQHFVQLMQSALATPQSNIGQLSVLSDIEREQILKGFNAEANKPVSSLPVTKAQGIIDIFKACVGKHAHKTALAFGTETMSYVQLDEWSNQIAYTLLNSHAIKPQDRIAIYADRSPWMIACILAVLKSGAAYVPIDPKNPKARTEFMLQDSQSRLVLTHSHYLNDLESMALPLLTKQDTVRGVKSPLKMTYQPDHLAYIMYTSGSSGTPKGVLVEQQSVIALVKDNNYSNVTAQDRLLQLSNYAFDGSVFDIFGALLSGASLHLIDNDMLLSPDRLCAFIKDQQINITFITTALINTLIDIEPQIIRQFDKIYFGGQEASLKHIQTALDYRKNADSIVHVYGPTETTTFASYHVVESIDSKVGNIPIGSALSQKQLYLLDEQMQPVPVGVTGEIFIGGAGGARAYLNRPKETEEAFLNNPFDSASQLYKTNDLARWNRDGQIEFLGRKDLQVKIRGFRVEFGEVENAILRHQAVEKVFVMAWSEYEGANKQLVAYCVMSDGLSMQDLRVWLATFLPDYMVPAHFIKMDELPLNSNGKVERKKLPEPNLDADENSDNHVAPRTEMEHLLAGVWSTLLGRKAISVQDNYFGLGGDSIKAIQMIAALQKQQVKMEVKDLYTFPTIETLAPCLTAMDGAQNHQRQTGIFDLTPIQQWFVQEKNRPLDVFNQDMLIRFNGAVKAQKLTAALNTLVDFHDLLRASLNGDNKLQIKDKVTVELEKKQLEDNTEQLMFDACDALNQQMNLEQGPLLRACLITRPDGQYLYLLAHHMVIAGVSWRILLEDLQAAYLQEDGQQTDFVRTSSANEWVEYLGKTEQFDDQVDYWTSREASEQGMLALQAPLDSQVCSEHRTIDPDLTNKLLTQAHESFNTQTNDLLLFALARALKDSHGQQESLIFLEGHGREDLTEGNGEGIDLSRTIGWFTSMYPVAITAGVDDDLSGLLKHFKEQQREIPDKGLGFGVLKYLQKTIDKDYCPTASFNYLGQFDGASVTDKEQGAEQEQQALFELSSLKTAKTNADHLALTCPVDIVAHVESGQLQLAVFYSHSLENQTLVNALLDSYVEHLEQIIGFCCDTDDFNLTPSDIDFDGFDIDGLDAVLDNL
ncbi:MAG: amino acid adenylation domain-containing protein, partial [Algicola sp.]|nr:amino acid adenylation domain-containing protein [Algicola sp.]